MSAHTVILIFCLSHMCAEEMWWGWWGGENVVEKEGEIERGTAEISGETDKAVSFIEDIVYVEARGNAMLTFILNPALSAGTSKACWGICLVDQMCQARRIEQWRMQHETRVWQSSLRRKSLLSGILWHRYGYHSRQGAAECGRVFSLRLVWVFGGSGYHRCETGLDPSLVYTTGLLKLNQWLICLFLGNSF